MKSIDLTGARFGLLTVTSKAIANGKQSMWNCVCDCGLTCIKWMGNLRNGNTKSCGHLRSVVTTKNKTTHAMYGAPEYKSWSGMLTRCENKNNHKFKDYGARGITVCDSWHEFQSFFNDMGKKPAGTSLGRIDNDGNYEPKNCEWQSATEQARNKRNTALFSYQGILATIPEHCDRLGLLASTVRSRIYTYKWPVEKALSVIPRNWGGPIKNNLQISQPA